MGLRMINRSSLPHFCARIERKEGVQRTRAWSLRKTVTTEGQLNFTRLCLMDLGKSLNKVTGRQMKMRNECGFGETERVHQEVSEN